MVPDPPDEAPPPPPRSVHIVHITVDQTPKNDSDFAIRDTSPFHI